MTTATHAPTVRVDGHGHVVTVGGRELRFDALTDHGEELIGVAVWTHDLPAVEALWRARAYLEGPYAEDHHDPAVEWGWPDWRDSWPDVDDDLSTHVRRAWARWYVVTEDDATTDESGFAQPGDLRFDEAHGPGDGLKPVTVVRLVTL